MDTLLNDKFLTEKQVSDLTSIPLSTLRNSRFYRKGIPYIKFNKSVRYSLKAVLQFMDSHLVETNS